MEPPTILEQIKKRGELRVLTRNSSGIYYEDSFGPAGVEYELANEFAKDLGVKLTLIVEPNSELIYSHLALGKADMAAAMLSVPPEGRAGFIFSEPYHKSRYHFIYRQGEARIKNLAGAEKKYTEIAADSYLQSILAGLKGENSNFKWHVNHEASPEELLELVQEKLIDATVVSQHDILINQYFYPELRKAFPVGEEYPVAWAFAYTEDNSLIDEANKFLSQIKKSGLKDEILERHFDHIKQFDYVGTRTFQRHIVTRLVNYLGWFEKAGKDNEVDWMILAAMSYQESHWNPDAVSPTGVRGLMMLTRDTAKYLGLSDRTDVLQSLFGGAWYFARLKKRIPDEVKEPDRTWFALASYNLGFGHVKDAMDLTRKQGKNQYLWSNLKKTLPLLHKQKWHKQTRYGYARGNEAVTYVENIRSYYNILRWEYERQWPRKKESWNKAIDISPSAL